MKSCCNDSLITIERLREGQIKTLKVVLAINVVMFFTEILAGLLSGSSALMADSLDNLGDALTYGLSMYAVRKGARLKSLIAMFKAAMILAAGVFVLAQVLFRFAESSVPAFQTMGIVSVVALVANTVCLVLLARYRNTDVNMRSAWECSRNDIASNASVFIAGIGVWITASAWPDLIVGLALAMLFFWSSASIFRHALDQLRKNSLRH